METKEIQKLLDFIASSGLDEVIIETSELKVKVRRNSTVQAVAAGPAPLVASAPAIAAVAAAPSLVRVTEVSLSPSNRSLAVNSVPVKL